MPAIGGACSKRAALSVQIGYLEPSFGEDSLQLTILVDSREVNANCLADIGLRLFERLTLACHAKRGTSTDVTAGLFIVLDVAGQHNKPSSRCVNEMIGTNAHEMSLGHEKQCTLPRSICPGLQTGDGSSGSE